MTLSTEEQSIILWHYSINPTVQQLAGDYTAIADYYGAIPTPTLTELMGFMSPLDRHKYFALERFGDWYSAFNLKLHNGTATVLIRQSLAEIVDDSKNLLAGITLAGLTSQTMQQLVTDMFARQLFDCLFSFLVCLSSDGIFEQNTVSLYSVELSPYPRWQTLGLSTAPTAEDIAAILE
jgi:hypothetical protein